MGKALKQIKYMDGKRIENHFCGMLVVNKEQEFTSSDVVAKLRGIVHMRRIGHTGTLDPMAEGVLPVCLGNATKIAELIADRDKEYVARLRLGVTTDTQDMTGTVLTRVPGEELLERLGGDAESAAERIRAAAAHFTGVIHQIPPMYSAVWSDGRRLYELAREGITVERKAREVTIHELEVQEVALPYVTLRVVCSKGTYIRTLCEDIGSWLGVGGAMDHLLRTRVGIFRLEDALTLGELQALMDEKGPEGIAERLLPVDSFFMDAPAIHIRAEDMKYLRNGNALSGANALEGELPRTDRIRVYDEAGEFYALYHYEKGRKRALPTKMFHDTDSREFDKR